MIIPDHKSPVKIENNNKSKTAHSILNNINEQQTNKNYFETNQIKQDLDGEKVSYHSSSSDIQAVKKKNKKSLSGVSIKPYKSG